MHFKNFQAKQTTQDKPIKFVASTANPDRYGDVVDLADFHTCEK